MRSAQRSVDFLESLNSAVGLIGNTVQRILVWQPTARRLKFAQAVDLVVEGPHEVSPDLIEWLALMIDEDDKYVLIFPTSGDGYTPVEQDLLRHAFPDVDLTFPEIPDLEDDVDLEILAQNLFAAGILTAQ